MKLRLWKLDVVSRERPFIRTGAHRSLPRRAANLAIAEAHLRDLGDDRGYGAAAWVTSAAMEIGDRLSRANTGATWTQSAGSGDADIFTVALPD
jgi:hypothetical protein